MTRAYLHQHPAFELDAIEEAEENGGTIQDAMRMQAHLQKQQLSLAIDVGDTCRGTPFEGFIAKAIQLGFQEIARYDISNGDESSSVKDSCVVLHHEQTDFVVKIESHGNKVNSAKLFGVVLSYPENGKVVNIRNYGGSHESLTHPEWKRDRQFFYKDAQGNFQRSFPTDLMLNFDLDVITCFVSKFQQASGHKTIRRPTSARFEIWDQVFVTGRDYPTHLQQQGGWSLMQDIALAKAKVRYGAFLKNGGTARVFGCEG